MFLVTWTASLRTGFEMQMFSSERSNGTLEPVGFIDFVAQWLPRGEVSEVLENDLEPSLF
jgi:hypothetical protein